MKTANIAVTLLNHMGCDLTVVNAARVSFDKESGFEFDLEELCVKLSDADKRLVKYLAKHDHWSPFAHTSVQFRVKAPIFVARQLVKHQVGGVWNEVSRRYVDSEPEFYIPSEWRGRPDGSVKQGSGEPVSYQLLVEAVVKKTTADALATYNALLSSGIAPEMARMVLPQNTMTEWYWTGSLMFWARVCRQRLDAHAQAETQQVALLVSQHMRKLFPVSWDALMNPNPQKKD
jgi:thymidylate synthase (FAD)